MLSKLTWFSAPRPPAQPPDREENDRAEGDVEAPAPRAPAESEVDHGAGGEGDSDTPEGKRDGEQPTSGPIPLLVFAVETEEHAEARSHRSEVPHLEGEQQILEGGPEEENQDRGEESEPAKLSAKATGLIPSARVAVCVGGKCPK